MNWFRKKLINENGASLVLTMLFMLVCIMVGGSIILAAVANASKSKGNEQERQAYLALSSALRVVAEDICDAEYYGKYNLSVAEAETEDDEEGTDPGEGGSPGEEGDGSDPAPQAVLCTYEQLTGVVNDSNSSLEFLKNDLDYIFAEYLITLAATVPDPGTPPGGEAAAPELQVEVFPLTVLSPGQPYEFKITPQMSELAGFEVTITAQFINDSGKYDILLTAVLSGVPARFDTSAADYRNYQIRTRLVQQGELSVSDVITAEDIGEPPRECYSITPLSWELDRMERL